MQKSERDSNSGLEDATEFVETPETEAMEPDTEDQSDMVATIATGRRRRRWRRSVRGCVVARHRPRRRRSGRPHLSSTIGAGVESAFSDRRFGVPQDGAENEEVFA